MPDYDGDALAALDEWFGQVLAGLSPAQRRRAGMKLGKALRRSNLDRIARNVEPDGGPMEARKARLDQRGRVRRKAGGKMFRKLRLVRQWSIKATPDSVEIMPAKGDSVARTHHYGLRGFVGRGPDGAKVYTRYPERRLLGFDDADRDIVLDVVSELFER
ncbi:MAG: phage virion morphogenesis protein [Erythrobacter sp.]|uniref:phage virion morphogenesis protein n=1 Tax=Erythrobacter sp. TaxID=1042 RepID=UPI0025E803A9|nr:phage virion morphogenesis protein [Erythrobacter sp.]MCM0001021.1 phage virion morphogenesis protein [Erythrobacter sp.]